MKIEDLYLELGRAMTAKIQEGQKAKDDEKVMQAEIADIQAKLQEARNQSRTKQERIQVHIDELQEAIRLASEGLDPCLAKLTAKESLEEQKSVQKALEELTGNLTIAQNKMYNAGTYYGNYTACNAHPIPTSVFKGTTGYTP